MSSGDILFYKLSMQDVNEELIAFWEGNLGDFIHCAIDMGDGTKIEALHGGVTRSTIGAREIAAVWQYPEEKKDGAFQTALSWLSTQVSEGYGWGDILDAFFWKFEKVVAINAVKHYDCSHLAALFLLHATINLGNLTDSLPTVTPQQLADQLGVKR